MPTYTYKCPKCGHEKEIFHSINGDPDIICPKCEISMKRQITGGTGFIVKGGGTRNRNFRSRYGHKKSENQPTPLESSLAKASQKNKEKNENDLLRKDPYAKFRK